MLDDLLRDSGSWFSNTLVDAPVFGGKYHHSVSPAASEDQVRSSAVIVASVEEKVSDLVRTYPHLRSLLKSGSNNPDARIRDLTISTGERDQLLHEILAARRQELHTSANLGGRSMSPPRSRMRLAAADHDARDPCNDGLKGLSR